MTVDFDLSEFDTFTGRFQRKAGVPGFSVQARGALSANAAGFDAMGRPEHILLMFSPAKRQIAMRAVPAETPYAVPMRPTGKGSGAMASAKSFFDTYGINYDTYSALPLVHVADGLAVLDASEVVSDEDK